MRELIYLSERKLYQFREEGSRRRHFGRRRITEFGATAPLGFGELQVTLGDSQPTPPSLDRVVSHLKGLKLDDFSEVPPDAGRWVKFKTRMNYEVLRPTRNDLDGNGEYIERAVGPPAVVFWEPSWSWSGDTPRLLLHGSPEHLLELGAKASDPSGLRVTFSSPPGFMDLLYGSRPGPRVNTGAALRHLLGRLDTRYESHTAALFSGYARVTFGLMLHTSRTTWTPVVVASPLYVERAVS